MVKTTNQIMEESLFFARNWNDLGVYPLLAGSPLGGMLGPLKWMIYLNNGDFPVRYVK